MAMKKCPGCGKEYDEEMYEECPFCIESDENEKEASQSSDETVTADEVALEQCECDCEDGKCECECDCEDGKCECECDCEEKSSKNTKAVLNSIIAVLAVFVVLALGRIIWLNMPYNASNTIDVDSFSAADLSGTYIDSLSGQYFEFEVKSTEIEINSATEALSDGQALSDGMVSSDGTSPKAEPEKKTFEGTYVARFIEEKAKYLALESFISQNGYAEEYISYKIAKGLKEDDFESFVKDYGYEKAFNDMEAQANLTKSIANYEDRGYWNIEENVINLYDDGGNLKARANITKNGISFSNIDFAGKVKKSMFSENTLVFISEDGTFKQTITTYKDGNLILTSEEKGQLPQRQVGVYCISGDTMTFSLGGSLNNFVLTDNGITQTLFNKK